MTTSMQLEGLARFIEAAPCNFFAIAEQARTLTKAGYEQLGEGDEWAVKPGGKYFTCRNGSALVAWRVPEVTPASLMVMASHSDSPTLRIKTAPEVKTADAYTTLNVELYGGALLSTWFDRPLSMAGRIMVQDGDAARPQLVNIKRDLLLIPSLAIHMNREANKGFELNVQKDLLPLYGNADATDLMDVVAAEAGVERSQIISHELVLYNRQAPVQWGANAEYFSAPRLDDLMCAYSSLAGFLASESVQTDALCMHVVFDNEEVGSSTKQGAASTLLKDTFERICNALRLDVEQQKQLVANGFMLSADNGHALHPNYPEKCDPTNQPTLGAGLLVKHAANQRYTTDAASEAVVSLLAQHAGVRLQHFFNRSDTPGGSTLGNISTAQLPLLTADIGAAQLAMHSAYETCSANDADALVALATELFSSTLSTDIKGGIALKAQR